MFAKKLILVVGCSIFFGGCSSTTKKPTLEHWNLFGPKSLSQTENIMEGHTRVIFIRDKEGLAGPAANVFIEGHYLTSLLPGAYKEV